jgi:hypothetical protein
MKLQDANLELLVNSAHGVYIPKIFWDQYKNYFPGFDGSELSDPNNEYYWEVWDELLNKTVINDNGIECAILHMEDVWAIPVHELEQIEEDSWF